MVYEKFAYTEGLTYDPSYDRVTLYEKYFSPTPIIGVKEVIVGEGARVGGDIYARLSTQIYTGSVIVGNIFSKNEVKIICRRPKIVGWGAIIVGDIYTDRFEVSYARGENISPPAVIYGNVIAREAEINGPILIRGNLLIKEKLNAEGPAFVLGRVRVGYSNYMGEANIRNFGFIHIYVNGNLTIGDGVTTIAPIIAVRNGNLRIRARKIRVINFPCLLCGEKDITLCKKYMKGECDLFDFLDSNDYFTYQDREFLAWYWRATPRMLLQHFILEKIYQSSLAKIRDCVLESSGISGIPFKRFYPYVLSEIFRLVTSRREFEQWLAEKYATYITEKLGAKVVYCPNCSFPNPESEVVICVRCGHIFKPAELKKAEEEISIKVPERKEKKEIKTSTEEFDKLVSELFE